MPQQESVETPLGGLQIPEDIVTSAAQVTEGRICNRGDIDGYKGPGVATVDLVAPYAFKRTSS
jgi:hypothetical protein